MDRPQEPAWLRSYKSRAAPFATTTAPKPLGEISPLPRPAEASDRTAVHHKQTAPKAQDPEEPITVAFPSTISLGLHSFGRRDETSGSIIHPALRGMSAEDEDRKRVSHNSSMTKVEVGHEEPELKHVKIGGESGWRRALKRWIRTLMCNKS